MNNKQVLNLITSRRTCYKFLDKITNPISEDAINDCLEAAITAPNHKLTQPWRFWKLTEQQQTVFANIYADNKAKKNTSFNSDKYQEIYNKSLTKFMAIPKIILVGQYLANNKQTQKEDYAACACAIQNFSLMAWQQSIGMQWSTGPIINDDKSYQLLNIEKNQIELIGALYIGNINESCLPSKVIVRKKLQEILKDTSKNLSVI